MILPPLNDQACLGAITDVTRSLVTDRDPELTALARELATMPAVVRWIRSLPQRDDVGQPADGPKVDACSPPQRLRLPAPDPNCVERAALYVILGELLAPEVGRRLATVDTDAGLHTLPIERDAPVVLDPRMPRNAAWAGLDRLMEKALPTELPNCAAWACEVAAEPAAALPGGARRVRNARPALQGAGRGVPVAADVVGDVALTLALAAREARRWGPAGEDVVGRVTRAVLELQEAGRCGCARRDGGDHVANGAPRNGLRLPRALGAAARAIGSAALETGATFASEALGVVGVPARFLAVLERELQREGLSLGALARPTPPPYSFAALTQRARAARQMEGAGGA